MESGSSEVRRSAWRVRPAGPYRDRGDGAHRERPAELHRAVAGRPRGWAELCTAVAVWTGVLGCHGRSASPTCPTGTARLQGACEVVCASDDACLVDEICDNQTKLCVPGTGPAPMIRDFHAASSPVVEGRGVVLVYAVANATAVRIDPGVTAGLSPILAGSILTGPLATATSFTLTAYGPGGRTAGAVDVGVSSSDASAVPVINAFAASPNPVPAGGATTLTWAVTSTNGVVISDSGGAVLHRDSRSGGSFSFVPAAGGDLTLTATSGAGYATAQLSLAIGPPTAPGIDGFTASNPAVIPGANVLVEWATHGMTSLALSDQAGTTLYQTSDPSVAAIGQAIVPIPYPDLPASGVVTYLLTGRSPGGVSTASVTLQVADPPEISGFSSTPASFMAGGPPTPVALTWEAHGATGIALTANGETVPGPGGTWPSSGSAQLSVHATTSFQLTAWGPVGSVRAERRTWALQQENDDDDTPQAAMALSTGAAVNTCSSVALDQDDWYLVGLDHRAHLAAGLTDGTGQCGVAVLGATLELYHGPTKLGAVKPTSPGVCPLIAPLTQVFARDLAPDGQPYFLHVTIPTNGVTCPAYVLTAMPVDIACGNQVLERGEDCDDGNNISGDGCSAACQFEPGSAYTVTAQPSTYIPLNGRELAFTALDPNYPPNDEGYARLTLPFPFTFFGRTYGVVTVFVNGYVTFSSALPGDAVADGPQPLPSKGTRGPLIAALWYDLVIDGGAGNMPSRITYTVAGSAPNRQVIIDYQNLRTYDSTPTTYVRLSAQIILDEGTSAIHIRYGQPQRMGAKLVHFVSGIENHQGLFAFSPGGCNRGWCDLDAGTAPAQATVTFQQRGQGGPTP